MIVFIAALIKYLINALEWSGLLNHINLDYLEDYLDNIWPFTWFVLFFTCLMEFSAQRVRESENHYRTIFNSATDSILLLDATGRLIDFNTAAASMTGYTAVELSQKCLHDLFHEFDSSVALESFFDQHDFSKRQEMIMTRQDGTSLATEVRGQPIKINGQHAFYLRVEDVTERKQAEAAFLENQKIQERWKKMESLGAAGRRRGS